MRRTKLLSLMLILCMLCALLFTACSEDNNNSSDSDESQNDVSTNPYLDENGKYVGSHSGKDYTGETIAFLTCSVNTTYESEILYNDYEDGTKKTMPEVLNDNLKYRSDYVEEVLGLTIEEVKVHDTARPGGGMCTQIREGNLSATEDYQIVVPCLYDGATLAVEGHLYNLLGEGFESLQIEAPWWNQQFNANMTLLFVIPHM